MEPKRPDTWPWGHKSRGSRGRAGRYTSSKERAEGSVFTEREAKPHVEGKGCVCQTEEKGNRMNGRVVL